MAIEARYKWPLTNLCYAAICLVAGGLIAAVAAANDSGFAAVGGFIAFIGVLYLIAGLWHLSQALMADDE